MTTNSIVEQVEALKAEGNRAFSEKNYKLSVQKFTEAIEIDPTNAIFYSNRSAAYASSARYEEALNDADKAIEYRPDWSKGYGRKGAALQGLGRLEEALTAYRDGLKLEPGNMQLTKGLEDCEQLIANQSNYQPQAQADQMFTKVLSDPQLMSKLARNQKTAEYLKDPSFSAILQQLQRSPSQFTQLMSKDKRLLEVILVGMDLDMRAPSEPAEHVHSDSCSHGSAHPRDQYEDQEEQEQDKEADKEQTLAEQEKELGNKAYKEKDFTLAMEHYAKAAELNPKNMKYLLNQSAVLFEQGLYTECIAMSEKAVDVGREHKADFKQIAKALARAANCHHRLGDFDAAIKYYNKSLTEHRSPEALERLRSVEKERDLKVKASLHDPLKAEEERNLGNELFKQGKYADAVKHYTEAIRRDDQDPRSYSNRAACYIKLAAVPEGLKDCDRAIQFDPKFIKAYTRKASLLVMKKEWSEAAAVLDLALAYDVDQKHSKEINDLKMKVRQDQHTSNRPHTDESEEETRQRALKNPEVMQILSDPAMQSILQQMQADPRAALDHMKNPLVAGKIRKLIDCGILRTG